ncbi:Cyclic di-GMP phosphodiesterase response regulator RpfG [Marinomonas aquimarina]|uniref:Cyclic di-GMP phosphodiesterase response regulator RpfG n=1 Tax=Marinomonas aquimarina TaxID=295068 RepID=A0A1A8TIQ1_9GAMM|nr:HD domain-containing phosphohydrolase [Marinomonas aquimarina]SBS32647.1 Cyclic di-GMP phosphodiesterase response regulator RpfG [Marinomonas aquimarina]
MQSPLFARKVASESSTQKAMEDKRDVMDNEPWKVALIDDEEDIITVSEMVLKRLLVDDRPLTFLKAHSAKEAMQLFEQHSDIAIAMVDVVMETDHAGLDLVKWIRESHKNTTTRLVLRTGQPGQAPEEDVIRDYDINDYKHKTELNSTRLKTTVYSAIRSYRDIKEVESGHQGLEHVVRATTRVLQADSSHAFAVQVLTEIEALTQQEGLCLSLLYQAHNPLNQHEVIKLHYDGQTLRQESDAQATAFPSSAQASIALALELESDVHTDRQFTCFRRLSKDCECVLSVSLQRPLSALAQKLLNVMLSKVAIIFESLNHREEIERTQQELMFILGEAIEQRSKETGSHVRRVSLICELLAREYGLQEDYVLLIKHATPMHDIGKIAIPEHILHKPAKLDPDEWEVMQTHAQVGHDLLCHSKKALLMMGASIALNHHEKWNGAGYPAGLKGGDIPIEGRIMAIADVIDALAARRSYKEPWPPERILALLQEERGQHFDPQLCDIAIKRFDDIMALRDVYPD